ncbi:MAG: DUF1778 domain-containing protein [Pirellulales bacterium]
MSQPKFVTISIPATAGQRDLIDRAAASVNRARSEFMLQASCRAAESVLLDQKCFKLSDGELAEFQALLDTPPVPSPRLLRTLKAVPPWESK